MQRVALVGAGKTGKIHAECYSTMPDVNLVAVVDVHPKRATEVAAMYGAEAFSDAQTVFAEADFDAIDICAPTVAHTAYIKLAAAAGKHVCCEEPFGSSAEECREAARACEKAGCILHIVGAARSTAEYTKLKELIKQGEVGSPATVRVSRWLNCCTFDEDVVVDVVGCDLGWLLSMVGPIDRVYAKRSAEDGKGDCLSASIRFKNGVIGQVDCSVSATEGASESVDVIGDKGMLRLSIDEGSCLKVWRWLGDLPVEVVPLSLLGASIYRRELGEFIAKLDSGDRPDIELKNITSSVAAAVAVLESVETGLPVKV